MIKNNFHEKITLFLSFFILNNYLFLSLNFSTLFLKINFILFLLGIVLFYFKNLSENVYLKIFFILIILISLGTPVFDWDPRSIWLFHAKRIFYDNSIYTIADNYAVFSHNDYPSLVPAFAASLATLLGYWNEVLPKLSFTFIFLPPLVFAYTLFSNSKYLIFLSLVLFIIGKYLFNGWSDGLIAVYFCLGSYLMFDLFIRKNKNIDKKIIKYFIAFFFFITLSLIKNEGLALLLVLFFTTICFCFIKKTIKENLLTIALLLTSFIPIFLWKYFCYSNGIFNEHINTSFMSNLIPRLKEFDNYFLIFKFLLLNEKFLFSLLIFVASFMYSRNKELFIFVSLILGLYTIIISLIFLGTPVDFYFQLNSSAARIVKTLSFTLSFFALYNLSYKTLNKRELS